MAEEYAQATEDDGLMEPPIKEYTSEDTFPRKPKEFYSKQIVNFCQTGEVGDIRKTIVPTHVPGLF